MVVYAQLFKVLVNVARLFQHVHHIEFGRHGVTGLGFRGNESMSR